MEVEPVEFGLRVRVGHHHDRRTVTAADVGDARTFLQLRFDAVERGYPRRGQERPVPRAEEPLGAAEQAGMVVAPAESAVAEKRVADLLAVGDHRDDAVHPARHEGRRRLVGEQGCHLTGHRVPVAGRVERDQSGGGLAVEPLAGETRVAAGRSGQVVRGHRAASRQRPVIPQFVAQPDGEAEHRSGHVARQLANQLLDTRLVDRHSSSSERNRAVYITPGQHAD